MQVTGNTTLRTVTSTIGTLFPTTCRLVFWCLCACVVTLSAETLSIGVLTDFEGGSVGKMEQVSRAHLRCAVKGQSDQDHRNRQANWYYFELTNLPRGSVTIDLVDLAGEYNYKGPVYSVTAAVRPVYSYDNAHWERFADDQVAWDEREPHLTLRFTPQHEHVWIAHVTPYTNKDLRNLLELFRSSPYLEMQSVGRTVEGREMPLLTITDRKFPERQKKVIWLMFRQHAWETGSSWAGDGAVRFCSRRTSARRSSENTSSTRSSRFLIRTVWRTEASALT